MNHRAQGALSYLLIIGGAVLVAAIVISLISAVPTAINPKIQMKCAALNGAGACNTDDDCVMITATGTETTDLSQFFRCGASSDASSSEPPPGPNCSESEDCDQCQTCEDGECVPSDSTDPFDDPRCAAELSGVDPGCAYCMQSSDPDDPLCNYHSDYRQHGCSDQEVCNDSGRCIDTSWCTASGGSYSNGYCWFPVTWKGESCNVRCNNLGRICLDGRPWYDQGCAACRQIFGAGERCYTGDIPSHDDDTCRTGRYWREMSCTTQWWGTFALCNCW